MGGHGSRVCLSSDRKGFFQQSKEGSARGEEVLSRGLRCQMVHSLGPLPGSAFLHLPFPFCLLLRPDWFSSNIDLCFRCRCNTYPLHTASLLAPSFLYHLSAMTVALTSPVCSNTSLCTRDILATHLLSQAERQVSHADFQALSGHHPK